MRQKLVRKIGYARVSRDDQNLELQRQALRDAGCEEIFEDQGLSGTFTERPALDKALAAVGEGDTFVVYKLDRLGRSLPHLISVIERLRERGVHFRSLTESIDTSSAYGEFFFHVTGAFAQLERALIAERTKAGLGAAKRAGRTLGRPLALGPEQLAHARSLLAEGRSKNHVARLFGVDRKTLWRHLQTAG